MAKKKKKKPKGPDFSHLPHGIDWDSQGLGKHSDRSIAKRLGVSQSMVSRERVRLGIPTSKAFLHYASKGIDWDNEPRLGKMFDTHLAKELGVSGCAVRKARKSRSIPTFSRGRSSPEVDSAKGCRLGIDWSREPLGKMLDMHIAILLGCSNATVALARKNLGIPPFRGKPVTWSNS